MRNFFKALTVVAATSFAAASNAGFISGSQSFQDVNGNTKNVNLSGLQWMTLDHTVGLSRDSIDGKDWTDNQGNDWGANEWRYATRAETNALINSLWGGTFDGYGYNNYQGVSWFANNFGGMFSRDRNDFTGYQRIWYYYGAQGECGVNTSCSGVMAKAEDTDVALASHNVNTGSTQAVGYTPFLKVQNADGSLTRAHQGVGYISEYYSGNEVGLYSGVNSEASSGAFATQGSFLVRNLSASIQSVSEPSTILMFSVALLGLGARARRKTAA